MSSSVFSAVLRPDPGLRRVVLCSGVALAIVGVALIASMPFDPIARLALAGIWSAFCSVEWRQVSRGFRGCRRLCLMADGQAMLQDPDGHWHAARVRPGSVILRHVGWLVAANSAKAAARSSRYAGIVVKAMTGAACRCCGGTLERPGEAANMVRYYDAQPRLQGACCNLPTLSGTVSQNQDE